MSILFLTTKAQGNDSFFENDDIIAVPQTAPSEQIRDPLEKVNRVFFFIQFSLMDKLIFRPISKMYDKILPTPVKNGVNSSLNNLDNLVDGSNALLIADFENAGNLLLNLFFNLQTGLVGFSDQAKLFDIKTTPVSFGLVLRKYGFDDNIFFVTPVGLPGTLADGLSFPQSILINPYDVLKLNDSRFVAYRVSLGITNARYQNSTFIDQLYFASVDPYIAAKPFFYKRIMEAKAQAKRKITRTPTPYNQVVPKSKLEFILE